jgi:hypothetical protein
MLSCTLQAERGTRLALMVFIGYSYAGLNHLDKEY